MRPFVELSVRRPVSVIMAAIAVVAFGWVALQRLPLELLPDISYPSLVVQTEFPDTAPQEVENLVTRPIEEVVGVLRGLTTVHSVSRAGFSEVTLEFDWGSDMGLLSLEVREKLDRLVLPEGARNPLVLRYDPSLDPILRLAFSGDEDLAVLRRVADRQLKPDLETVLGVASAQVRGGLEEEIQVAVDQERLAALGIPLGQVRDAVGAGNLNLPGGALRGRDEQFLVRTINEYDDVAEIADIVVSAGAGGQVRVRDVADVYLGAREREEITRVAGRESVEIAIYREGDANTVTVAREVRRRLAEWEGGKLPPGLRLDVLFDQSVFIARALAEVRDSALLGGLLAVIVLFAFLRHLRSTLIIALSIPLSVVATFVLLYELDISLNLMSLGGLTLGIGMLVDNSIVVLEAIARRRQQGQPAARAAIEGTSEVAAAVTASTLTTVAVFLPIVFVEGIAGQLFRDQALTVTFSLLASLAVAVSLIPMLSAVGGGGESAAAGPADDETLNTEDRSVLFTLGALSRFYDRFLVRAVRYRARTLLLAFGLFAASVAGVLGLGVELIPELSEGEFYFEAELPEGTSLAATDRVVQQMEAAAARDDGVALYYATVGSRSGAGGVSANTKAENLGQLNVVVTDRADAELELAVAERLRREFATIPDLQPKFGRPAYFTLKTPIEVQLFGEDLELLRDYSLDVARRLAGIPGLVDVRSSLEAGNPELQVVFDRDRLAALGLDMATLSQALQDRVQGAVPTRFREEDRQIDIRVRNREDDRRSLEDVANLVVPGPNGEPLRLVTVADVRLDRGPAEVHRLQQQRAAVVSASLDERSLGGAVQDVWAELRDTPPPPGLTVELGGQNQEMEVSFRSLRFALALAAFLVYLVMAATFESFLHPLIVMFTIPLALIGVVAALLATGTTVTVIVLIGAVMLVGIVVNNAILLIDTVNRFRRGGLAKEEAVIRAGHSRLRPILMTTATTVLGLVPMAVSFGQGSELRSPLAITVASGLTLSTLLTLVVIPAAYLAVPSRVRTEDAA
ncbi:MAG TPA: efflux RND transporter permease subunit [Candidatus Krumholzibacteria bacterium]|nr:efflux RND transporter permease subunit [Candidatus Krumholzibacteria bacterium]HPD70676.1 efflux RND transporter permease subunit [Candidatus Krumholzibacteria bacterium]HRY39624.1 efflux RND transporter permease subunit [Candidatus Krumholzibacteria bacterium]